MVDIFVISHACFTAINRNVYQLFYEDGYNIELVVPKTLVYPSGIKNANPKQESDPPIHFLNLKGTNPRMYEFEGIIQLLNTKKPKVILLDNDPVSTLALYIGKWATNHNAKVYATSCENLDLDILSNIKRRGIKSLLGVVYKRSLLLRTRKVLSGVFAINKDGQKIFIREGFKNVQHMPLGFDTRVFNVDKSSRKRVREKLNLNKIVIAYFGRLIKEKGIHILIQALSHLKQYEWQLMMDDFDVYGTDYTKEIHKLLQEAEINDRVVFISPSHFEIASYMNAADVVVVPSLSSANWKEQYGRVAAESLACGKTVVASNSGALPELLGGNGILTEEGDAKQLATILGKLINENCNQIDNLITEKGARYAKQYLSIEAQKKVIEKCIKL